MLSGLAFTSPLLLIALLGLPVLWWLLRIMPPQPELMTFPPLAFLLKLRSQEETPHHTPLWLLVLRLVLVALLIVGLAGPVLNPPPRITGSGPLALVVDDGWGSAATWSKRLEILRQTAAQAGRDKRLLAIITTAPAPGQLLAPTLLSSDEALKVLDGLEPRPWETNRGLTAERLEANWPPALARDADFIWLSDGLASEGTQSLARLLSARGTLLHLESNALQSGLGLTPPKRSGDRFESRILRVGQAGTRTGRIRAIDSVGRPVGSAPFAFEEGQTEASAEIKLPLELQNTIARIEIIGERSAGAVSLVDERWRRRSVGIATAGTGDIDKPLLSDVFYIDRALEPFAETRSGSLEELLERPLSALILPDIGQIPATQMERVETWVNNGGLLIRFAGPRIAERHDPLVPVPLRQGGRALGGAMSWEEPQHLAAFDETSPFFGLTISTDVTVSKQVLAEPSIDLASHTWARLSDGTPLVTAASRGDGWTVLFHITGNPDWSTLPMSGLFVEMLERAIAWSQAEALPETAEAGEGQTLLYPKQVMNGFGELSKVSGTLTPVALEAVTQWKPGADTPPGLYRRPAMTRALNLTRSDTVLTPLALPSGIERINLGADLAIDLKPWALTAALLLLLADGIIILLMGKLETLISRIRPSAAAGFLFAVAVAAPAPSEATESEALKATLKTHLAYVITGDAETDRLSERGLVGLSDVIAARTAVEPGKPIGINPDTNELAFFPLIYFPVSANHKTLSPQALEKLSRYMRTGGTVIFDTQDQQARFSGGAVESANARKLRELLSGLDIPPLAVVPDDHVLTKSFYLLREFPGRWQGGKVWVEDLSTEGDINSGGSLNDGVSSIIIGANDWAAAWAIDDFGRPLAVTVPGGVRQRELAYRFGVNIVMYTLTGNYKADQVHVPALLERLGE